MSCDWSEESHCGYELVGFDREELTKEDDSDIYFEGNIILTANMQT